jgi:hypothetical protein
MPGTFGERLFYTGSGYKIPKATSEFLVAKFLKISLFASPTEPGFVAIKFRAKNSGDNINPYNYLLSHLRTSGLGYIYIVGVIGR